LHPELFRIHLGGSLPDRPVGSYGVLIIFGVTAGLLLAISRARRYRIERFDELAVGLLGFAGGIAGAVTLNALVHLREVIAQPSVLLEQPGLVFYGGVGGGALAAWLYCRKWGISLATAADAGAPGLALGHAFGRVGCLMGGCCYGRTVDPSFPLAVELHGASRHPVQLYEAAGLLAICALLLALSRRLQPRPGALVALYLGSYAILRLGTETLRADDFERGVLGGAISTSQAIALAMLAIAALVLHRSKKEPAHGGRERAV
jgi:phosphatidylglycerol:prolipoprotein diacylglycerol transferase